MNSESFHCDSAGQGSLPDVPKIGIACTFCAGELVGVEESLPHYCPHCHKELRPASDSLWSNLWYGMRRLLSCSGRATCKEFWVSMILIWIFTCIAILAFCINLGFWFDSDGYINFYLYTGAVIALFLILLIIGQGCLLTRRLHDVGFSGYWALLGCILSVSAIASYIVPLVSLLYDYSQAFDAYLMILSDLSFVSVENEIVSTEYLGILCGLDEPSLPSHQINYLVYTWYPYSMRILLNILYTADVIVSGFLFVSCFIDSQRGVNKYGISRKYPLP